MTYNIEESGISGGRFRSFCRKIPDWPSALVNRAAAQCPWRAANFSSGCVTAAAPFLGGKLSGISGGRFRSICAGQAISAACGQKRERRRLEGTFQRTDASGCSFEGALFDGASAKRQAAYSEESAHGKNFIKNERFSFSSHLRPVS